MEQLPDTYIFALGWEIFRYVILFFRMGNNLSRLMSGKRENLIFLQNTLLDITRYVDK